MQLPYSEEVEIQYLSRLFDNTSECYKFFWFQAIVTKVLEGKTEISYGELLDEMIADAWYMVTEYRLNLGPKDNLEALVTYIRQISGMKPSEKKSTILDYLRTCEDKEVMRMKRILILNVPYRLQAPFMHSMKGKDWDVHDSVYAEFEKCAKKHLKSGYVKRREHRKGLTFLEFSVSLEEVIQPVYQSAKNCGFKNWIYREGTSESDNILL